MSWQNSVLSKCLRGILRMILVRLSTLDPHHPVAILCTHTHLHLKPWNLSHRTTNGTTCCDASKNKKSFTNLLGKSFTNLFPKTLNFRSIFGRNKPQSERKERNTQKKNSPRRCQYTEEQWVQPHEQQVQTQNPTGKTTRWRR